MKSLLTRAAAMLQDLVFRLANDRVARRVLLAFSFTLLLFGFLAYLGYLYQPPSRRESVVVGIPPGSTVAVIGTKLEAQGVIKNGHAFTLFVRLFGKTANLKAGTYEFMPGATLGEVLDKLVRGDVLDTSIRVTIPEGLTLAGIGLVFENRGLFTQNAFLAAAQDIELPYTYLTEIPAGVLRRLEGYLFPDTYSFMPNVQPEEVIRTMAARFNALVPPLYAVSPLQERFTLHEIVTMASIVEKEAVQENERAVIAGVFFNRLQINMRLESCATIQFLLGSPRPLLYADLEIVSPYNTYRNVGLPPGPIANSGLASFAATLAPSAHSYLFFVAQRDGSHIFSRTYEQHLAAIRLARR